MTDKLVQVPYWRLSGIYFLFFSFIGVLAPYWSPYLASKGLTADQIGTIFGIAGVARIISPHIWAWIGDHTHQHLRVAQAAVFCAGIMFCVYASVDSYVALMICALLFGMFFDGCLPQFEVVTLNALGEQRGGYSRIRLWGSVGFMVTSVLAGIWIEHFTESALPPPMIVILVLVFCLSLSIVPLKSGDKRPVPGAIGPILRNRLVWLFFLSCFFIQASHGAYYGFYSLYLAEYGYSDATIGMLWALGVFMEVVLFWLMPKIISNAALYRLWVAVGVLTATRWLLIYAFPSDVLIITLTQCLHAVSFGLLHVISIQFINQWFTSNTLARGQAIYSSFGFGAGVATGAYVSGQLWERVSPESAFLCAAGLAGIATVFGVALYCLSKPQIPKKC